MDLHLDDTQSSYLRKLLTSSLGDLRMEIANTDNPEYRRGLQADEATLRAILAELGG